MTDREALAGLVQPLGYRYVCTSVTAPSTARVGQQLSFNTTWRNAGTARAYPRMGQDFVLNWALVNVAGHVAATWVGEAQVSDWLPGDDHVVATTIRTPDVPAGQYELMVSVTERTSGRTIALPLQTARDDHRYPLGTFRIRR